MMRVLQISIDTVMGGIESFILDIYKRIDRRVVQFDFIEYGDVDRDFDYQYTDLGAKIFTVPDRKRNPIQSAKSLKQIIEVGGYSVVHIHKNSLSEIGAIKICRDLRIPTIIVHSHNCNRDNKLVVLLHKINRTFLNLNGVNKLACSKKAAVWMYGTEDSVTIVTNGIDIERFNYNEGVREKKRAEMNLENTFVIGTVGRLTEQKNPLFAIKLIQRLKNVLNNIKFVWVGDGDLRDDVENLIREFKLDDDVLLVGAISNPEHYYQLMDVFIMPSFYEGFPIAAIEAQCSGLPIVLSEQITREADLTDDVYWCDIDNITNWENIILKLFNDKYHRKSNHELLKIKGFDINATVKFLQDFYILHDKTE